MSLKLLVLIVSAFVCFQAAKATILFDNCLDDQSLTARDEFQSICNFCGYGKLNVVVYKDGILLGNQRFQFVNGTIKIKFTSETESGVYLISVTDSNDAKNRSVHINVLVMPEFLISNVQFERREGENITINCIATGNPKPKISLFHNGQPLSLKDGLFIEEKLKKVHTGNYTCLAKNSAGEKKKDFYVTIYPTLKAPLNLTAYVSKNSDSNLTINVAFLSENEEGTEFQIDYSGNVYNFTTTSNGTQNVIIEPLKGVEDYSISVSFVDKLGSSGVAMQFISQNQEGQEAIPMEQKTIMLRAFKYPVIAPIVGLTVVAIFVFAIIGIGIICYHRKLRVRSANLVPVAEL